MPSELASFYISTRSARKVIVVELGFLGDSVHLVPALWELRRHYPDAALHVLAAPVGCEVLGMAPCVDQTWPVVLDPQQRSLRQQGATLRALRRERFDVAFNFGGADRTILMTALSGARWRVAHAAGRWHFWNRWLIPHWVPKQDPNLTVFEQKRRVLTACGFTLEPPRFDLKIRPDAANWAGTTVPPNAVHLSINSAKALKEWPLEHAVALVKELLGSRGPQELTPPANHGCALGPLHILASGTRHPREQQRLQALVAQVNHPRLQLLPSALSISQLAAVLRRCRLHIGPDSGVIHLATALGVPTISFFREQPGYGAWVPTGPAHHVFSQPCTCVDHRSPRCEPLGHAGCLARIAPGEVAALARRVLASANP